MNLVYGYRIKNHLLRTLLDYASSTAVSEMIGVTGRTFNLELNLIEIVSICLGLILSEVLFVWHSHQKVWECRDGFAIKTRNSKTEKQWCRYERFKHSPLVSLYGASHL